MTNEQREVIDKLTNGEKMDFVTLVRTFKKEGIEKFAVVRKEYLDTVLSLIKEQQGQWEEIEGLKNINKNQSKDIKKAVDYTFELNKELERKDKQIDLMAELVYKRFKAELLLEYGFENEDQLKQYFAGLVEKE